VAKNVKDILSAEHMKKVFDYEIISNNNIITLKYKLNDEKRNYIINYLLGKSILFANQNEWSNEQIVITYRS
jgi:hypothetical protein